MKIVKTAKNTYLMKGWFKKRLWVLDDAYAVEVVVLRNPVEVNKEKQEGKNGKDTKKTTKTKVRTK